MSLTAHCAHTIDTTDQISGITFLVGPVGDIERRTVEPNNGPVSQFAYSTSAVQDRVELERAKEEAIGGYGGEGCV